MIMWLNPCKSFPLPLHQYLKKQSRNNLVHILAKAAARMEEQDMEEEEEDYNFGGSKVYDRWVSKVASKKGIY